jgi:hypothetical protein
MKHWIYLVLSVLGLCFVSYYLTCDNSEKIVYAVDIEPSTTILPVFPGKLLPMEDRFHTNYGPVLIINWIRPIDDFSKLSKTADTLAVVVAGGKILIFNFRSEVVHGIRLQPRSRMQNFVTLDYARDEARLYILGKTGRNWTESIILLVIVSCSLGGSIAYRINRLRHPEWDVKHEGGTYGL